MSHVPLNNIRLIVKLSLMIHLKVGLGELEESSGEEKNEHWAKISRNLISHYISTNKIQLIPSVTGQEEGGPQCASLAINSRLTRYNKAKDEFQIIHKSNSFYEAVSQRVIDGKTAICPMDIDYFQLYELWVELFGPNMELTNLSFADEGKYQCEVAVSEKCNNVSACSTDECNCQNGQVMYCPTKSGQIACISFANMCNGIMDCVDGSDECFCPDSYKLTCHRFPQIKKLCVPKLFYCTYLNSIKNLDCEGHPKDINCTDVMDWASQLGPGNP